MNPWKRYYALIVAFLRANHDITDFYNEYEHFLLVIQCILQICFCLSGCVCVFPAGVDGHVPAELGSESDCVHYLLAQLLPGARDGPAESTQQTGPHI